MEPKPQEKEHKPMAENIPVMCPPVGDRLSTSDNGGRLPRKTARRNVALKMCRPLR